MKNFNDLRKHMQEKEPKRAVTLEIAGKLLALRTINHLTAEQLSEKSGVPLDVIQGIENGAITPQIDDLVKIASATGQQLVVGFKNH